MVAPVRPMAVIRHYLRRDVLRLVVFVVRNVELHKLAAVLICPQLLALAPGVVADDGVGRVKDMAGAAVVLLQPDSAAALELVLKRQDIFYRRAAELIYALIVITYDAYVPAAAREKRGKEVLKVVCVLILVYQDISEAALPVRARVLML